MKKIFINEIKEKDQVSGPFLVTKKESGISKSGKAYLNLKVMDKTGEMEARVWENAEAIGKVFSKNDIVEVKGFAVAYQGGIQINVTAVAPLNDCEYSLSDFLPCAKRDPKEMLAEIEAKVAGMEDRFLRPLLQSILTDPEIRRKLLVAPAAKAMHHPYLGGLLEHVLSICGLAEKVCEHYGKEVNQDLLLSGAILHDIGKIYELSYERSFDYTDEGRLLGHIPIGVELLDSKIREIKDFPKPLAVHLKHMLLSHHGLLEYGSPKRPKTLEALILYYLDDLDAKVNVIKTLVEAESGKETPSSWSPYQKIFERYIYTGRTTFEYPEEKANDDEKPSGAGEKISEPGTLSLFK